MSLALKIPHSRQPYLKRRQVNAGQPTSQVLNRYRIASHTAKGYMNTETLRHITPSVLHPASDALDHLHFGVSEFDGIIVFNDFVLLESLVEEHFFKYLE